MKKIIATPLLVSLTWLLVGCVGTTDLTTAKPQQIRPVKLADGNTAMVVYNPPQPAWQCAVVDNYSQNWGLAKLKGMAELSGPYSSLTNQAVAYAEQHALKTNLIYLAIPTTITVGSFSSAAISNANVTFFACNYPPVASNKIF